MRTLTLPIPVSQTKFLIAALATSALLYVSFALTPSHYAMALRLLGDPSAEPLLGKARAIRSDEWIVMTPFFQIAVAGGLSPLDTVSPYGGSLKGFFALPIADWSLVFKPQLWGFWVLPPAYAYSLYFCVLWVSFLSGFTILLRQLGASLWLAVLGAVALLCSHFVQAWWTSNAATFAFAPWPLIVFVMRLRWYLKLPALFYATSLWLLAYLYPPFIISAGFALGVAALAFRRDVLTISNVIVAAVGVGAALGVVWLYFGDLIITMQQTVYPGSRSSSGGGVPGSMILAHLLPFFTTSQLQSVLPGWNDCEVATVATFLPLMFLAFVRYDALSCYIRYKRSNMIFLGLGLTLMLAWMVLPVPNTLGRLLLWNNVPPPRMLWGFGLLLTISIIVVAAQVEWSITLARFYFFVIAVLGGWVVSKIGFTEGFATSTQMNAYKALSRSWFDWLVLMPAVIAVFMALYRPNKARARQFLFAACAVTAIGTFGRFNPVQPAHEIFAAHQSPRVVALRAEAAASPNGWIALPGMYGSLLNGVRVPAINHTLAVPQLAFFRRIFPTMPEGVFNQKFNRYAHIVPDEITAEPLVPQPDVIRVPIAPFQERLPSR